MTSDIDLAREDDRQFFRELPARRLRLRYAWPCETVECREPTDSSQRWFVIATQYNDRSVGWHPPFLADQSENVAMDDIGIHRLQQRVRATWRLA